MVSSLDVRDAELSMQATSVLDEWSDVEVELHRVRVQIDGSFAESLGWLNVSVAGVGSGGDRGEWVDVGLCLGRACVSDVSSVLETPPCIPCRSEDVGLDCCLGVNGSAIDGSDSVSTDLILA